VREWFAKWDVSQATGILIFVFLRVGSRDKEREMSYFRPVI